MKYIANKDFTACTGEEIKAGTVLYECTGCTYGCLDPGEVAATHDPEGGYPFFAVNGDDLDCDYEHR